MNADLQKQLAEMLRRLVDVSADATTWAGQQIPPLVQEKIMFGRIWETVLFLLLAIGTGLIVKWTVFCWRRQDAITNHVDEHPGWIIGGMLGALSGTALSIVACLQLEPALMAWFAPRLYIVEWLHGLIRN